ncbi:MAG: hypothetical protein II045_02365 [Oscillospiraceae bacterium]|jgi:hypothetical protein|nr:hypothetical protein [Oscillospiraceae bacterium]MBQ1741917.1 hypothetical protein [Oscillospiraceae bacterium]MBQ1835088.1 hypothetical protein [Oscillospiraceae bacterium]MBQ2177682.1 hypothetical protein [Oscillospiraceae bacterium]MBQ2223763.1 hypothetical protein [Oscillospiraceae bacterium]
MAQGSNCEDCIYYSYDEEYDSYYCEQELDEDEMVRFLERRNNACPFYHSGESDYYLSGRQ